mmetsp:Transcript_33009/g.32362  ORF Transcript_33009/g.32362 Transcript_33009/m.32362 type:complete len:180 (+) Transcript_33009:1109-1648(+)
MQPEERLSSTLNKTASKLTDTELKKEKKPRVPKTRRPRLKAEKKESKALESLQRKECTYDPSSIKIFKEDYTHLDDCLINNVLQDYNNFVNLTFKNKGDEYDFCNIKRLAKRFGIVINQKALQEENGFKDKTIIAPIKEKLLNYLWKTLNDENGMETFHLKSSKGYPKLYKFFVGRGNN